MKKTIILTLVVLFVLASLCACDPGTIKTTSSASSSDVSSQTSSGGDTTPKTLADYVKTAKEATQSFSDGNVVTYRLPEILLDSSDADTANSEIMARFGEDCQTHDDYSPVISMDYEAYLSDNYLSVLVTAKYDGGNSYGLCYCFDVTSGSLLNNETLCSMTGRDYNAAIDALTANVTTQYDSDYANLPGNDTERSKTLDPSNIEASKMYIDENGKLMAQVEIYAAVGGGHWCNSYSAE